MGKENSDSKELIELTFEGNPTTIMKATATRNSYDLEADTIGYGRKLADFSETIVDGKGVLTSITRRVIDGVEKDCVVLQIAEHPFDEKRSIKTFYIPFESFKNVKVVIEGIKG